MIPKLHSGPPAVSRKGGFTLVEIVVSLTIISVIAAAAIPSMKGLASDEKIREPLTRLAALVQETRRRALHEGKPYQIVFEPGGIHAGPAMYPYEKLEEYLKDLDTLRHPELPGGLTAEAAGRRFTAETAGSEKDQTTLQPPATPWTESIPLDPDMECRVLLWGDGEWDPLDSGEMRRWEFQPSGMSNTLRVRLRLAGLECEEGFDALTGEQTGGITRRLSPQS